ncbi:MAG: ATP-dependent helicase [Firmicutes bacterium]|nr:ATP-dependent helicase [Bacillota bacterium]
MNGPEFFAKVERAGWGLTAEQRAAVEHADGPGIVFAGPGSGKTTVITLRAAYLHEVLRVPPEQITVFTFTRQSAEQLRTRLARIAPILRAVCAGTFHSIFMKHLLRATSFNPVLLGTGEARGAMRSILRELRMKDSAEAVDEALAAVSAHQTGATALSRRGAAADVQRAIARYQAWKQDAGRCDFDDVIRVFYEALTANFTFAQGISQSLRHVMVDEFQDASPAEWSVVQLLAERAESTVVVGDDDQAIYGFRGADAAVMQHFVRRFPEHQAYVLARNHRSRDPIINVSRQLINHNDQRREKELHGVRGAGARVICRAYANEWREARAAAAFVAKAEDDGASVAVLARTARQLYPVATVLRLDGRSVRSPSAADLFSHPACRPVRDFLEAAACSQAVAAGRGAFVRYARAQGAIVRANPPGRSVDEWLDAVAAGDPAHAQLTRQFSSLLARAANAERAGTEAREACLTFVRACEDVLRQRTQRPADPAEHEVLAALGQLFEESDVHDVLAKLFAPTLSAPGGTVQLLTFHAAKGLEFDRVCAIGLHDQALPHSRGLREAVGDPALAAAFVREERRLLYVACTRAREMLALLYPQLTGRTPVKASVFLREAGFRAGERAPHAPAKSRGTGASAPASAPPALASVWSHRLFGDGSICSVEPMMDRGHKVGMRFSHGQVRYFLWEMSVELGHVQPLKGRGQR